MPELPEVETIRRQLEPEVVGRGIEGVEILDERWTRPDAPAEIAARLEGRRIASVGRRGKYLLVGLEDGATLVMHLRMTGNIVVSERRLGGERLHESPPRRAHLRAVLQLSDARTIEFTDARRFGNGTILEAHELGPYLDKRLGVEPLGGELTPELIGRIAQGRTTPLKSFLLNQKGIAGIGNIYADEALHRARLHPLSPAGSMREPHWEELRDGIVAALELGIANGGSSIDDYRDARGERGSMQEEFLVHTREGQACPRCSEAISRIVVGGRSTYFCGNCQVRLRRRRRRKRRSR
ncbi:MAG: bifunctional DNA-formamidopyrimidine glycosylase/DNA-(apurinic or apyrimidinic site) lyase [Solirubrobacterales bacterium]